MTLTILKRIEYALGIAIGLLTLLLPIKADSQPVTSPTPPDTHAKLATPVKQPNYALDVIKIQNEAKRKAEEARQKAIEAAQAAEAERVAQETAAKEKEAQKASNSVISSTRAPTLQSYPQSDNFYKAFIYAHESGNDPTRMSANGCLGLGQACPASKLLAVCPTMDYACEDAFFDGYAQRYGGWAGSYAFWQQNHWW